MYYSLFHAIAAISILFALTKVSKIELLNFKTYHRHRMVKIPLSPFAKLSSGVRKTKINKQDANKFHKIGSHIEMKFQCRFDCYSAYVQVA